MSRSDSSKASWQYLSADSRGEEASYWVPFTVYTPNTAFVRQAGREGACRQEQKVFDPASQINSTAKSAGCRQFSFEIPNARDKGSWMRKGISSLIGLFSATTTFAQSVTNQDQHASPPTPAIDPDKLGYPVSGVEWLSREFAVFVYHLSLQLANILGSWSRTELPPYYNCQGNPRVACSVDRSWDPADCASFSEPPRRSTKSERFAALLVGGNSLRGKKRSEYLFLCHCGATICLAFSPAPRFCHQQ
jgi:hypothetical protein